MIEGNETIEIRAQTVSAVSCDERQVGFPTVILFDDKTAEGLFHVCLAVEQIVYPLSSHIVIIGKLPKFD